MVSNRIESCRVMNRVGKRYGAGAVGVFWRHTSYSRPRNYRRDKRWLERSDEAGEPTGAREHGCGPGVILTASVKGAREGARVKIMPVGCPQTAGRASRSGAGLTIGRCGEMKYGRQILA